MAGVIRISVNGQQRTVFVGDKFRGYEIVERGGTWYFADTGEPVAETWQTRPCGHCGKHNTPEGHDGCLGTIPSARNACCGHGVTNEAYIQFGDLSVVRGEAAAEYLGRAG